MTMLPRTCIFSRSSGTADGGRRLSFLVTYDAREASAQLRDFFPFKGTYEVAIDAVFVLTLPPGADITLRESAAIVEVPKLFVELREQLLAREST